MFCRCVVRCGVREASAAHAGASLLPEEPATQWYSIEFTQGMGRGVERVVEAEKG